MVVRASPSQSSLRCRSPDTGGHQAQGRQESRDAQRQVDQEDPVPGQIRGQGPAHERCQHRRQEPGPHEEGCGPQQFRLGRPAEHHEGAHGDHHGPAGALQDAAQGQHGQVLAQRAEQGRHGEDGNGQAEDAACAEPFGEPAAERDAHGHRHQVGRHGDVHAGGRHPEVTGDAGNGGGQHRAVQEFHEERRRHQQGQPRVPRLRAAGCEAGAGVLPDASGAGTSGPFRMPLMSHGPFPGRPWRRCARRWR